MFSSQKELWNNREKCSKKKYYIKIEFCGEYSWHKVQREKGLIPTAELFLYGLLTGDA